MNSVPYRISRLISKSLQDTLEGEEVNVLNAWLAESAENRRFYKRMQDPEHMQANLDYLNSIDLESAWNATRRRIQDNSPSQPLRFFGFARIAAALLIFAAVVWLFFPRKREMPNRQTIRKSTPAAILPAESRANLRLADGRIIAITDEQIQLEEVNGVQVNANLGKLVYQPGSSSLFNDPEAYNVLTVPKKGFYKVVFGDGTSVWLNADSRLTYPVQFNSIHRTVQLSGEAYFEVAKDPQRPFYVRINNETIRVLGTRFNVHAYSDVSKTTLVEGSILVQAGDMTERLVPGQEALFKNNNIIVYNADVEKAVAWKNGEFIFRRESILQIMEEISRWYDVDIVYKNREIDKRFNGTISRKLQLHEVLDMLTFLSDYEFQLNNRTVTVKTKEK